METVLSVDVCFKYVMNTRGIFRCILSKKHSHLHQVRNLISAHLSRAKLIKRMPTYFPNKMKLALALFASQSQVPSRNFFQCVMQGRRHEQMSFNCDLSIKFISTA